MEKYDKIISDYLDYCSNQKRLNPKTIRAYTTDLKQLTDNISSIEISDVTTVQAFTNTQTLLNLGIYGKITCQPVTGHSLSVTLVGGEYERRIKAQKAQT